jgi:hypothetical protein
MAEYFFVATPFADLEASHWRMIEAEVGGPEAIVFALRLRGLAAQSNRGGFVCLRTGDPMSLKQIGTYMGYSTDHGDWLSCRQVTITVVSATPMLCAMVAQTWMR